jgi:hypothetical protein
LRRSTSAATAFAATTDSSVARVSAIARSVSARRCWESAGLRVEVVEVRGADAVEEGAQHAVGLVELRPRGGVHGAELVLDEGVARGAEEVLQQPLAALGGGEQQVAELPLRQHDHPGELLVRQVKQPNDLPGDVLRSADGLEVGVAREALERGGGAGAGDGALARDALGFERAGDAVAPVAEGEVERDLRGRVGRRGDVAEHLVGGAVAEALAVERPGHRVEQRALTRSGIPVDEEEPRVVEGLEVDRVLRVGPEVLELEGVRPHAGSPVAARASRNTPRSSSVGAPGP